MNRKDNSEVLEQSLFKENEKNANHYTVSLPVIPSLKMTTQGLVDVDKQERISLYCD